MSWLPDQVHVVSLSDWPILPYWIIIVYRVASTYMYFQSSCEKQMVECWPGYRTGLLLRGEGLQKSYVRLF